MRGCVLGPPAVGKTCVVAALCKHYKLHHIKIKDVIDEAIELLVSAKAFLTDIKEIPFKQLLRRFAVHFSFLIIF